MKSIRLKITFAGFLILAFILNSKVFGDSTFGGNDYDESFAALPTKGGGYIIAGSSRSPSNTGSKASPSYGSDDYWIQKIPSVGSGTPVWQVTLGGTGPDTLRAIKQTQDGGYIVGGNSMSGISGNKTTPSLGGPDFWIIKLDANGNKQWEKTFGGIGDDHFFDVVERKGGGYIFAGYSNFPGNAASHGSYDMWLIATDKDGNPIWNKTIGGSGFDGLYSIRPTSDGGYILGGFSNSPAGFDKTQPSKGAEDIWLVKIDKGGNILWDSTIGSANEDYAMVTEETPNGEYFVAGYSDGDNTGDKSEHNRGGQIAIGQSGDYWVVKTDEKGKKLWDKTIGGSDDDALTCAIQSSGKYILGGNSYSPAGFEKTKGLIGFMDMWIVSIDDASQGQVKWDRTVGGAAITNVSSIMELSDIYLLVGTATTDPINSKGQKTFFGYGAEDQWVAEVAK